MSWDKKFITMASFVSGWSKDRSTKVGCVIVGKDHQVLSVGYNGFPRGVNDNVETRHERPIKYKWTEHSERNAIYNSARTGTSLDGSTIYLNWYPCADCARGIIQSGINRVVCGQKPDFNNPQWGSDFKLVEEMFAEVCMHVEFETE